MTTRGCVLVTGSAGSVGRAAVAGLAEVGWTVRQIDLLGPAVHLDPPHDAVVGDCFDPQQLDQLLPGCDAVVHLAAVPAEADIESIAASHVVGTARLLEAVVRHRVPRVVAASSNHAVGYTPYLALIGVDVPPRPDTYHGVGQVATEALCSLATDRNGVATACLRIGTLADRPASQPELSTWLSPGDLVRLIDACLTAPDLRHAIVYGTSANTRGWWDLQPGRTLGYHPQDDSEAYAGEVLGNEPADPTPDGEPLAWVEPADEATEAVEPATGSTSLADRARAWLAGDPDPDTRTRLDALLDAAGTGDDSATAELADAFAGTLQFGTAGLRGAMGPGPNRMNRVVVSRAAAGLAAYLTERGGRTVVIGYDARHKSERFARDTAEVMEGAGLHALLLPRPLPTPVLAHAIRIIRCAAGVMVTASHNPPQDNGYKVYLGDGTQIVPPTDSEISAYIAAVGPVGELPRSDDWELLGKEILQSYLADCVALAIPDSPRDVRVAYTAMHGVGGATLLEVLRRAGYGDPVVVAAQLDPDPDFTTVSFPNPEEPGAMDLAIETGTAAGVDVIIANDPDADRCAVAVPRPDGTGFGMLRGDEVGALLGWWMHQRAVRTGRTLHGCYANSIVSSSLLARMAADYGVRHEETLTGFKWIGRIPDLTYGYEEALGYCVDPRRVGDKDGVSAALLVVELVAALKAEGRTVHDLLDDLAIRYGLHATDQLAVRVDDAAVIAAAMARLRDAPPGSLAGLAVESFEDLEHGSELLPPTDGLRLRIAEGTRVIVRPSGTEPKLKCYLEVVVPVAAADVTAAREVASARLAALKSDLAQAAGLPAPTP